jgi:AcrR family transcriptional regulator
MFTENSNLSEMPTKRGPGRPPGRTPRGEHTRSELYEVATALIAERGYAGTTMRAVAQRAGVSPGLLYRYFPSKRAVVLALYDQLSADFARRAEAMPPGGWWRRFAFALETSMGTLGPHRDTLAGLTAILVGDPEEGLFAPGTVFSRRRVQQVFIRAVTEAADVPGRPTDAAALGRVLYLAHLAVILWWLLDRSRGQRTTRALVDLLKRGTRILAVGLRVPGTWAWVRKIDGLARDGLFGGDDGPAPEGRA